MKEDNISQLCDYDAPFCEQQYTHGSYYISLFTFKSFDQFNTPQTASNFKHLLSCGTTESLNFFTLFTANIFWELIVHAQITWSGTRLVDNRSNQLLIHVFLKHINSMPENSVVFQVLQIDKDLHLSGSPNLMTMHALL